MRFLSIISAFAAFVLITANTHCNTGNGPQPTTAAIGDSVYTQPDTAKIPNDKYGELVRYGRNLMLYTAYYIGPDGVNGHYLGNKMNCTNCHQEAGTKPFSLSLMLSHERYPQYRAREARVLTLAERVNNCVMRPHSGKPLPLDSREMVAFLSYFRWINGQLTPAERKKKGFENLEIALPQVAGNPLNGEKLYNEKCLRCHGSDGGGVFKPGDSAYLYPPLWGPYGYQPGSSMHRVVKQARWLKANMPNDSAKYFKPFLTDQEAIDIACFVNDDRIHPRPNPKTFDYPHVQEKAIDYGQPPFADSFPALQHKFGPWQPIIEDWKKRGLKPAF
jgi:thiosulfate dehydrogenase